MTTATQESTQKTAAERRTAAQEGLQRIEAECGCVRARLAENQRMLGDRERELKERNRTRTAEDEQALPGLRREILDLRLQCQADAELLPQLEAEMRPISAELAAAERVLARESYLELVDRQRDLSRELIVAMEEMAAVVKTKLASKDLVSIEQNLARRQTLGLQPLASVSERFAVDLSELGRLLSVLVDGVVADWTNQRIDAAGHPIALSAEERRNIDPSRH